MRTFIRTVGALATAVILSGAGSCGSDPEYQCADIDISARPGDTVSISAVSGCVDLTTGEAVPWIQNEFLFEGPTYLAQTWDATTDAPQWAVANNAPTGPAVVTYSYLSPQGERLGEGRIQFSIECSDCRTIEVQPPLNGSITGPNGLNCPGVCRISYRTAEHPSPQLTAAPASGYECGAWVGCTPSSDPCRADVDPSQDVLCSITFESTEPRATLNLEIVGQGDVTVLDDQSREIDCTTTGAGKSCQVEDNLTVDLRATAAVGWIFSGWSGDCVGSNENLTGINVTGSLSCTATFEEATGNCLGATAPMLSVQLRDAASQPIAQMNGAYLVNFEQSVVVDLSDSNPGSLRFQQSRLYTQDPGGTTWNQSAVSGFNDGTTINWQNTQLPPAADPYMVRIRATNDCGLQSETTVSIFVP